jgi:uncharacterized small protein (DUF1192 family)
VANPCGEHVVALDSAQRTKQKLTRAGLFLGVFVVSHGTSIVDRSEDTLSYEAVRVLELEARIQELETEIKVLRGVLAKKSGCIEKASLSLNSISPHRASLCFFPWDFIETETVHPFDSLL